MQADRWKRIDELLDALMDLRSEERAAFLESECGNDSALKREVESLFQAQLEAEGMFEVPAVECAASLIVENRERGLVGQSVGPYKISSFVARGGMGEVYGADDTRLGRKVALKLLPKEFTRDQIRTARFIREAQAVSALNHPNILTIYDIGNHDGAHYISAEFVEGRTLREHLKSGPLGLAEAVDVVFQTVSALQAAHKAGIVHRDIKPENLMIRPDGLVKVLDFGIAKLTERLPLGARESAQTAAPSLSEAGSVFGTVGYMSPEQGLGNPIDARSDLFSIGVVFYEILTGRKPFQGKTPAATFNALLYDAYPPALSLRPDLPEEIERVLARALEKDRDLRYQTASDFRADLKRLARGLDLNDVHASGSSSESPPSVPTPRFRNSRIWIAAGLSVTVVIGALFLFRLAFFTEKTGPRWDTAVARNVTDLPGQELFPTFSPDGKTIVFASDRAGNFDLFRRRIGGNNDQNLTPDSPGNDVQPAFSPDGEFIAFRSDRLGGGLFVMGSTGESVRKLADFGYNPSWSPDGREIVFGAEESWDPGYRRNDTSALWVVRVETGELRKIPIPIDAVQPHVSPSGRRIAFWSYGPSSQRDIWTVAAEGGVPVRVTNDQQTDWNPIWSPDGKYIYFAGIRNGGPSLWRVPVDESTGAVTGPLEPVLSPVAQCFQFRISGDGKSLAYVRQESESGLNYVNFDSVNGDAVGEAVVVPHGTKQIAWIDLAPDGKFLTFASYREAREDISVLTTDGARHTQLTNDAFRDRVPRLSPDGKRIVFYSNASGNYELWTINTDGSGRRQVTDHRKRGLVYPFWSPDGNSLGYSFIGGSTFLMDLRKPWVEQTPVALPLLPGGKDWMVGWSWSPDGKKIAGWRGNDRGEYEDLVVYTIETQSFEVIPDAGTRAFWLGDNRRLVSVHGNKGYLIDTATRQKREIVSAGRREVISIAPTLDNKRLYFCTNLSEADIMLLTLP